MSLFSKVIMEFSVFSSSFVRICFLFIVALMSFLVLAGKPVCAAGKTSYLRIGAGLAASAHTEFTDSDCHSGSPAALFGCSLGNDGKATGAYGDFGHSLTLDMGLGYHWNEWLQTEIFLSYRPGFEFDGVSNFSQVNPTFVQTVAADVESISGMLVGIIQPLALFKVEKQKIEPFLLGGIGYAYNHTDSMVYTFPVTATITPDGGYSSIAWTVGAGFSYELTHEVELELTYRYIDLGTVSTDVNTMTILRRANNAVITDSIVIGETEADIDVNEVVLSIVWNF